MRCEKLGCITCEILLRKSAAERRESREKERAAAHAARNGMRECHPSFLTGLNLDPLGPRSHSFFSRAFPPLFRDTIDTGGKRELARSLDPPRNAVGSDRAFCFARLSSKCVCLRGILKRKVRRWWGWEKRTARSFLHRRVVSVNKLDMIRWRGVERCGDLTGKDWPGKICKQTFGPIFAARPIVYTDVKWLKSFARLVSWLCVSAWGVWRLWEWFSGRSGQVMRSLTRCASIRPLLGAIDCLIGLVEFVCFVFAVLSAYSSPGSFLAKIFFFLEEDNAKWHARLFLAGKYFLSYVIGCSSRAFRRTRDAKVRNCVPVCKKRWRNSAFATSHQLWTWFSLVSHNVSHKIKGMKSRLLLC